MRVGSLVLACLIIAYNRNCSGWLALIMFWNCFDNHCVVYVRMVVWMVSWGANVPDVRLWYDFVMVSCSGCDAND